MMKNTPDRNRRKPLGRTGILACALLLFAAMRVTTAAAETRLEVGGIDGGKAILSLDSEPLRTMTPT